ncbi:FAD/NAD(P)-binding protein [Streptomyces sp. NPDC052020]|uniref:FAD/NAD(P)-binding protein n=1 Tax=Streptomyces sp. NPDC052020 TaxID=3155677 RepID=UPI00341408F4
MQPADVAIIGAGASGTAIFSELVHSFQIERLDRLSIVIIDRDLRRGHGRVYGPDHPWLLMNTPAHALSIRSWDGADFMRWLLARGGHRGEEPVEHAHVSRALYGEYLRERFHDLLDSPPPGLEVEVVDDWVERLTPHESGSRLRLSSGRALEARKTVLATGPNRPEDVYGLTGTPGYVEHPYPASARLRGIPRDSPVVILGSSLSAVDVALTLHHTGHRAPVHMVSRRGLLPEVKAEYTVQQEIYNEASGADGENAGKPASLESALAVFQRFLSSHRNTAESNQGDPVQQFAESVRQAKHPTDGNFAQRYSAHLGMDQVWPQLDEEELLAFMRTQYAPLLHKNAAIPLINARKLLALLRADRLRVHGGLHTIRPGEEGGFRLSFRGGADLTVDHVINAMGPSKYLVSPGSRNLYAHLLHEGQLRELPTGGARVTFPGGNLLDRDGRPVPALHAVGHPTSGSHPYINNIELIVSNSAHVARQICADLMRSRTVARNNT